VANVLLAVVSFGGPLEPNNHLASTRQGGSVGVLDIVAQI
jgi:hypothetical protein